MVGLFQIDDAGGDPAVRIPAFLSLICSLMSLSYGCIYIVRFGTMRSMNRASRWADEAKRESGYIWWNIYVLLSMPAVWMAWSVVTFVVCILSYLWRTGGEDDPEERAPLGKRGVLAPRIVITLVFALGLVYFTLIIRTLARYGTHHSDKVYGTTPTPPRRGGSLPGSAPGSLSGRTTQDVMARRGRTRKRPTIVPEEEGEDPTKQNDAYSYDAEARSTSQSALGLEGVPNMTSTEEIEVEDADEGERRRERERRRREAQDEHGDSPDSGGWSRVIPRISKNDEDGSVSTV